MSPLTTRTADAVVVGAGLAGLVAATELEAQGLRVVVVEAQDRVGGRTLSHHTLGQTFDAGGSYVGDRHHAVRALAGQLGIALRRTDSPGAPLLDLRGSLHRGDDPVPALNALAVGDTLDLLDELAQQVDPQRPGAHPDARRLDQLPVRDWAEREFAHPDARLLVDLLVREMLAVDPEDVSMLHFLFYVRSGGGVHYLTAFAGGAQQERLAGGAHRLAAGLATRLATPPVLGAAVTRIRAVRGRQAEVIGPGLSVRCDHAVLALPSGQAGRIDIEGGRPHDVPPPRGAAVKIHLVYERPFWHAAGLSGWVTADRGPLRFLVDDSAGRGGLGTLVGFVTGREARDYGSRPGPERRAAVLSRLGEWLGPEATHPLAFLEEDWQTQRFVEGCYAAVPAYGRWASGPPPEAEDSAEAPVHRCGTEWSGAYYGHLEGAVRSGLLAARRVLGNRERT